MPLTHPSVSWRIVSATALSGYRVRVKFVDGLTGEIDLNNFLATHEIVGTVFEPLRDQNYFSDVRIVMGALQWPNGADLAPDAMHEAIQQHGCWIVE